MNTPTTPPGIRAPGGVLYRSPIGLYPFQVEHIAEAYLGVHDNQPERMFAWDTGLGKSHAVMKLAALAAEDNVADLVVLVCERNKLKEWQEDFERFTLLESRIHHGPRRKSKLATEGLPEVLITTYETGKADFVTITKNDRGQKLLRSNYLLTRIFSDHRRPMVVFDEADRLSNRTSANYRAYEYLLKTLRKTFKNLPVFMVTATSIRRDYENTFNQLRLLCPEAMPLVKEFNDYFVRNRDIYGKARYYDVRMEEFVALCQPLMLAKSKTDPDVIEQFPAMTEEALWVDLEGEQRNLYELVQDLPDLAPGAQLGALRQISAHPGSLVHTARHGVSKLAKMLVQELGEEAVLRMPSAKTERLVSYLEPIVKGQRDKAVVFSFYGPSVLPLLKDALEAQGMEVFTLDEIDEFKAYIRGAVLLSSDAGARGINIPEASYLVEYDMATTYGLRTQRLNRISRIGHGGATATVRSMLARETVEVPLMYSMLRGNAQSDELLGHGVTGEEFMTAAMRRHLLTEGLE